MSEVINGDSAQVLKTLANDSVDLVCSDPPYGYSFMGKDWDRAVPSVEIWKECLRVLKPGAFTFVMSAPRQDVLSQMIVRLDKAGFETAFTPIYWTYASGFPKAANISKLVDKKLGAERQIISITEKASSFVKCGETEHSSIQRDYNTAQEYVKEEIPITAPASPQAKALDGSYAGFQPKPAVEVIIVCMKPLSEKTYVDQAMANGKGATWLDDCRIPFSNETDMNAAKPGGLTLKHKGWNNEAWLEETKDANPKGRFPANLLVSDDVLNDGRITKSVRSARGGATKIMEDRPWNQSENRLQGYECGYNDSGSYSRYFDLDKWAQNVPALKTYPFLICPKASTSEKNKGLETVEAQTVNDGRENPPDNAFQRGQTPRQNSHPTVKPVKLMGYLIALGSRPGDLVLDPFNGSGTTGIAAKLLNRRYVGIELTKEYAEIAKKRIDAWKPEEAKVIFPEIPVEVDGVRYNALDAFNLQV